MFVRFVKYSVMVDILCLYRFDMIDRVVEIKNFWIVLFFNDDVILGRFKWIECVKNGEIFLLYFRLYYFLDFWFNLFSFYFWWCDSGNY